MSNNDDFDDLDIEIEEEEIPDVSIATKQPKAKSPAGTRLNLFFRSTIGPGEKTEKLTVDMQINVVELKKTLSQMFGLDPQEFHLSIAGRTMDNDDILDNYEILDGEEVLIIPVSTAGI